MRTTVASAFAAVMCATACGKSDGPSAASAGAGTTSTASAPAGLEIPAQWSAVERDAAARARDAWLAACAGHLNWSEFQQVSLMTSHPVGYLKDQFDWDLMVTITLTYKDNLDQRRGGQRLTFDMGAGNRPGIVTRKSHGIQLCGFGGRAQGVSSGKACEEDAGEDCILEVPELKALDAARPAAVVDSQRTAPLAWCFAHGFDPPQFWTCASVEKACKKALAAEKREENGEYRVRSACAKADALHCFHAETGKTVCAPDAVSCVTSRKVWSDMNTATACEVATPEMLAASSQPDDPAPTARKPASSRKRTSSDAGPKAGNVDVWDRYGGASGGSDDPTR